jgi:formylglycine-generating enzyme required for sulfatase activity
MNGADLRRGALLDRLKGLLAAQFEEVVFHCQIPESIIPGASAPQAIRAVDLIRYLEQQDRLAILARVLDDLVARPADGPSLEPGIPGARPAIPVMDTACVESNAASPARHDADVPVAAAEKSTWAVGSGQDHHGRWAAFDVNGVQHRMRWIPPGMFRMGSPRSEAARNDDEGPQHWVTITNGYWIGETPVTQLLWVAIMGDNPSRYRADRPEDLERPVERVSWDDCQSFLYGLNAKVPGLAARLPTEAEWEHACRAGRAGTTREDESSDPEQTPLARPGFVEIFVDEPRYPEPYPVRRGAPNPFGLHDMLGNVWEWCADEPRRYTREPVTDPAHAGHPQRRVCRGGAVAIKVKGLLGMSSAFSKHVLHRARAAHRWAQLRTFHSHGIGFRLAAGPGPEGR